jgi:protocatechuate 3,4-dioxygenase beta subunit
MEYSYFSRRKFMFSSVAGATGLFLPMGQIAVAASHAETAACRLDAELTQGPYYLDRGILRRDVTEGKPGLPLRLRLNLTDARSCTPLENAAFEIWHCDASGIYSGYTKMNPNEPPGMGPHRGGPGGPPPGPPPDIGPDGGPPPGFGSPVSTDNTTFCRGLQLSNADGIVEFDTVYPGWYAGRDIHIHLKVHCSGVIRNEKIAGGHVSHTGQLFFPDELSDEVAKLNPYAARHNLERTRLDDDMVFDDAHGAGTILRFERVEPGSLKKGLIATATVRVDPSLIPSAEHGPGRPRGPRNS